MKARPWFGIAIVATTLVVVACSGAAATPTASPIPTPIYHRPAPTTAAPTFSPTPVPTPNPSVLAIRPCTANDLVVRVGQGMGSGQHFDLGFGVTNISGDECRVHGAPVVELIGPSGEVIGTGATCAAMHLYTCPNVVTIIESEATLQPSLGSYGAYFIISWPSPVLIGESCNGATTPLAIELPDNGGRIDLGDVGMPSCSHPSTSELATPEPPTPTPDPTVGYR